MVERFIYRSNNKNNNNNNNSSQSKSSPMGESNNSQRNYGVAIESFTPKLPIIGNTHSSRLSNYTDGNNHSPSAHRKVISIPNEPVYNRSRRQDTLAREGISTARSIRSSDMGSNVTSNKNITKKEAIVSRNRKKSDNDVINKDNVGVERPLSSALKIIVDDKKFNTAERNTTNDISIINAVNVTSATYRETSMQSIHDRIDTKKLNKKYDRKLLDQVTTDVILQDLGVTFQDIAGNDEPKRILNEAVVLPLLIPEFFTGIRQPWKVLCLVIIVLYVCIVQSAF